LTTHPKLILPFLDRLSDLAREFPDTKSTVAALRMVVKLRKGGPRTALPNRVSARKRGRKRQMG